MTALKRLYARYGERPYRDRDSETLRTVLPNADRLKMKDTATLIRAELDCRDNELGDR